VARQVRKLVEDIPFVSARRRYEARTNHRNGKRIMADREFIAWDGEGWTEHRTDHRLTESGKCVGGCAHHYFLFGASEGTSIRATSLSTVECLNAMLTCASQNPSAIHVGYAFTYDVNMILRDIHPRKLAKLSSDRSIYWKDYRLEWMPKKWFQVTGVIDGKKVTCRIQDIFSFFGMSFVKSLKNWNVGNDVEWKQIEDGKEQRGDFQLSMLDETVVPYWRMELRLLVGLANRLRDTLYAGELSIDKWFGPGAIASFIYKRQDQTRVMSRDLPEPIIDASCHAYAGGRFEGFRAGFYDGPVYSADINSAYPYALSLMPNMATGRWEYLTHPGDMPTSSEVPRMGLFHVRYLVGRQANSREGFPFPAFYRHRDGSMSFPRENDVWVHGPEYRLMLQLQEQSGDRYFSRFTTVEAWVMHDDGTFPFSWVSDLYQQRLAWKREGNPAQLAAKLGLNSLYGKLAQRVGGRDGNVPPWHQLEWAGAITSTCRAMLYEGSHQEHEGLIAYETDGIYSTSPLFRLPRGTGQDLGQWETEEYTGMLYLQSGVYWLRDHSGEWLSPKSRGIPTKRLDRHAAIRALSREEPLVAENTQFIGYNLAAMRHGRGWRTWETGTKEFVFGGAGKRAHRPDRCRQCNTGNGWDSCLHSLVPRPVDYDKSTNHIIPSAAHTLPWRQQAPEAIDYIRRLDEGELE
jgi:DNA polymerase type B, organellar and viral